MALLQDWHSYADRRTSQPDAKKYWAGYFDREKAFYEKLLRGEIKAATPKALAEECGVALLEAVGFLDGINDSLKEANGLDTLEADSAVSLDYDKEKLYYNMVGAKAEWLYNLPEWDEHLTAERRKELYRQQKSSKTVVKGEKIGRNDPCPCGSGKKYKKCCGRNL